MITGSDWRRRRGAGIAVGVLGALALTAALLPAEEPVSYRPTVWFLVVVVAAALVGGLWGLVVATACSVIGVWFTVATPPHTFSAPDPDEWWGLIGYAVAALVLGLLVTRLETALRERDDAVEARLRVEADARAQRELDATRAELFESELQRLRVRRNVDALQDAMLPHELPTVPGFELDACYTPASPNLAVGGDWYDAYLLDADHLVFAVGDVSGHGVEAAALMAQLRNAKRAYVAEDPAPGTVMARLNRYLCRLDTEHYATVVFGVLDLTDGRCRWASAGHPAPAVFRPGGSATLVEIPALRGPLLGLREDTTYQEIEHQLQLGEGLLVYTDGLVERRGASIDEGLDALVRALDEHADEPTPRLCDRLMDAVAGGHEGRDDVCQLLIRRVPPS